MSQVPVFGPSGEFLGSTDAENVKDCRHPRREDDGECSEGCCDYYRCVDCGKRFRVECPE